MVASSLASTPYGAVFDWAARFQRSMEHGPNEPEFIKTQQTVWSAVACGEPYFVRDSIGQALWDASKSLTDCRFAGTDLPSLAGYMYFDGSGIVASSDGNPENPALGTRITGLMWSVQMCTCCHNGIWCGNQRCGVEPMLIGEAAGFPSTGSQNLTDFVLSNNATACSVGLVLTFDDPRLSCTTLIAPFGVTPDITTGEVVRGGRFVCALFEFLAQRVATRESTPAPRPERRRYEAQFKREAPPVNVIALRRSEPKETQGDGKHVDWSCQWTVRAHARQQWYPRLGIHKRRWIAGYVKGPAGKPLRNAERLFAVVR